MKLVIIISMGLAFVGAVCMAAYVLRYEKKQRTQPRTVTCLVMTDDAASYMFPGREFKARGDVRGLVDVIGRQGDWWKLKDGTYMPSYCLHPVHAGEVPKELR